MPPTKEETVIILSAVEGGGRLLIGFHKTIDDGVAHCAGMGREVIGTADLDDIATKGQWVRQIEPVVPDPPVAKYKKSERFVLV